MITVELYRWRKQWRWRARAGNGEIIASGESYANEADARTTIGILFGSCEVEMQVSDAHHVVVETRRLR